MVPEDLIDEVQSAISARLASTKIGNPSEEGVRMGPLATTLQAERVRASVEELSKSQRIVFGDLDHFDIIGSTAKREAFFSDFV